ncbi:50S ribosomal protein L6 [Candidatus Pacearchaeota archaeon]|nr:50S ribosomal protein L6 [Candidatus Pacearchaeota archaeon]|tara:strand:- start:8383 stop:8925 length:543 start_codon:yes stop_codon:yes gene_type:complete
MRSKIQESIEIPEGIECTFSDRAIKCKSSDLEISRSVTTPTIQVKIEKNQLTLFVLKGNKKEYKIIKTLISHLKNTFSGLKEKFVYELESANVHFPMTLKVEPGLLIINNFLGEKVPRTAKILPNVEVKVEGQTIIVSSNDREAAGQTAGNFEKATKVHNRDRRVYQDGIYITKKAGKEI